MKKFIRNLIQFMLISYVILGLFDGIVLPTNPLYIFATLLILSIGMLMVSTILKFLTIKENFITTFVMSSLIVLGFFFLLDFFMTGFYIESSTFNGFDLGSLILNSMEMTPVVTMTVASVCASLLVSILSVLEKSS
ncbi:MAG: hypothetical protein RBT33_01640 [Candidatus Dojkabacteria bacterium]|jgi:hypothetical protein|nr:hypothetical protein [Candidatus Dojkabacteria bacterium]